MSNIEKYRKKDLERLEAQEIESHRIVHEFIENLESVGVEIPPKNLPNVEKFLGSMRSSLIEWYEIPDTWSKPPDPLFLVKLKQREKFHIKRIYLPEVQRAQAILTVIRDIIMAKDLHFVRPGKAYLNKFGDDPLNDFPYSTKSIDQLKLMLRKIVYGPNLEIRKGFFWLVLLQSDGKYVCKLKKPELYPYIKNVYEVFPIIRKTLGLEFLPKQVVLKTDTHKQMVTIQQRVNIEEMHPISLGKIDRLVQSKLTENFRKKLRSNNSYVKKFIKFIDRVETLRDENDFMLDLIGENVFIDFDKNDKLQIKVIDIGVIRKNDEGNYQKSISTLEQLKRLI